MQIPECLLQKTIPQYFTQILSVSETSFLRKKLRRWRFNFDPIWLHLKYIPLEITNNYEFQCYQKNPKIVLCYCLSGCIYCTFVLLVKSGGYNPKGCTQKLTGTKSAKLERSVYLLLLRDESAWSLAHVLQRGWRSTDVTVTKERAGNGQRWIKAVAERANKRAAQPAAEKPQNHLERARDPFPHTPSTPN